MRNWSPGLSPAGVITTALASVTKPNARTSVRDTEIGKRNTRNTASQKRISSHPDKAACNLTFRAAGRGLPDARPRAARGTVSGTVCVEVDTQSFCEEYKSGHECAVFM